MSGQECSSTKVVFICAVRVPGGVNCRGNVYGHRVRSRSHGIIISKTNFSLGAIILMLENFDTSECSNVKIGFIMLVT